jgi:hypothetical protein
MNVTLGIIREQGTSQIVMNASGQPEFQPFQAKPDVNATVTCLFTCNSADKMTNLFNFIGTDQTVVVNTGGTDGYTTTGTLEWAAFGFVGTYVDTNGDLDAAIDTAQRVVDKSKIEENMGDAIEKKRPNQ